MNSIRDPKFDYIIIGAGPAGMAAAITARAHGLSVLVLDEQPSAGGQIFRNIESLEATRNSEFSKLGQEYEFGSSLVRRFKSVGLITSLIDPYGKSTIICRYTMFPLLPLKVIPSIRIAKRNVSLSRSALWNAPCLCLVGLSRELCLVLQWTYCTRVLD